jgi:steroid delta-isomerase-like uncharacterized protein
VSPKPRELVERFYHVVWNQADEAEAGKILSPDFRFRASLGPELRGPGGFIAYLRSVHAALQNFVCIIEEVIETDDRAAARMSFRGTHRAKFFGVEPTGREIRWAGAAFFTVRDGQISELWVLGDVEAVRRQLTPDRAPQSFSV